MEALDVLAVFAHPDDAELLCGGALIRSADAGERVGVLDLTRGELGSRGSAEVRAAEAERASAVMGLAVRKNAGLRDGHLQNDLASRRTVAGWLRLLRPRIVVTHWREGRHPDHRVASELVHDACFLAGLRNYDAEGGPHRPTKLVQATAFREDAPAPSFVLDITPQMERKLQALACYESQFEGAVQAGEVLPGGKRPLHDQIRSQCAHYGSLIRVAFGEPFHTRETVACETLGRLSVASF